MVVYDCPLELEHLVMMHKVSVLCTSPMRMACHTLLRLHHLWSSCCILPVRYSMDQ